MNNVPPPQPGTVNQMWLVGDKGPQSAGTMDAKAVAPSTTAVLPDLGTSRAVSFTVEPPGGSKHPTSPIFAALSLTQADIDPAHRTSHDGPDHAEVLGRGSAQCEHAPNTAAGVRTYDRMMAKDFRFGLSLFESRSRAKIEDTARRAQALGFDVMHVPDHLGAPSPFPVMTTVAMATETLRVGTFVLNAAFYKPALLARDAAALRDLSDGRLELGLGTGYVKKEFELAELPYPTAGQRVDHLQHMTEYMREHVPGMPILIAGNGDRVLTIAARQADIIGLTGGDRAADATEDPLAERIAFVRAAAGDRFDDLELNIAITAMPIDGTGMPDLSIPRRFLPTLTDQELLRHPGVLSGTPRDIADRIRDYRDTYGVSYIIAQAPHADTFSKVIAELR
jgi:probable F420-dependent oxidoreductase